MTAANFCRRIASSASLNALSEDPKLSKLLHYRVCRIRNSAPLFVNELNANLAGNTAPEITQFHIYKVQPDSAWLQLHVHVRPDVLALQFCQLVAWASRKYHVSFARMNVRIAMASVASAETHEDTESGLSGVAEAR
jgi:hypothetical protein